MMTLFGLRITPFFLFILSLECLAFLVSLYLATLLYQPSTVFVAIETIDHSIYLTLFLVILISVLTPSFFYQTRVIDKVRKSINGKIYGLIGALVTMSAIFLTSNSGLDSKTLFTAALLSACVGLLISQAALFSQYWRFLVRARIN